MAWTVDTLNHTVDEELNALPADMRARFTRVVRLIESFGVDRVGQPHVQHLQGRLWEMRLRGREAQTPPTHGLRLCIIKPTGFSRPFR